MDGVLVVDKARGMTSHDVVSRLRRACGQRRIGHAGTLDPAATGILVVALGEATKLVPYLMAEEKVYDAVIHFGAETDTLDACGEVVERGPEEIALERREVEQVLASFQGRIEQEPPRVSAIRVGGMRAHAKVRRGDDFEMPTRTVDLYASELKAFCPRGLALRIVCGKGFYVRSLARDLSRRLGTVGHLARLRRRRVGRFSLASALPYSCIEGAISGDQAAQARLQGALLPIEAAAGHLPAVQLSDTGAEDAQQGRPVLAPGCLSGQLPELPDDEVALLFSPNGKALALAKRVGQGLRIVRGFRHSAPEA